MINNRKTSPDDPQHQGAREGDYKTLKLLSTTLRHFDDEYESNAGDEITREEPKTEKEQRSEERKRHSSLTHR